MNASGKLYRESGHAKTMFGATVRYQKNVVGAVHQDNTSESIGVIVAFLPHCIE